MSYESKKKTVFERLGARSAGSRHSDSVESSSDSARIVTRPREDLERPHNREHSSTGAAGQSPLEIPSRSRKRGEEDDDYNPHKRKKEDGNEAKDRRIYSSKRDASSTSRFARIVTRPREDLERPHNREHSSTGAAGQSPLEIPSRSRKRGEEDDDYNPHKRKKEDGNEAKDRRIYSSKRDASSTSRFARIVTRPREDLERPHNREHSSTGAAGQSPLEIPSRSRKRGEEDDDYNPHKRKKEDGNEAKDRRIYSSKRDASSTSRFVRQPTEHKTRHYSSNDRPGCSRWAERNTGTKRKFEYHKRTVNSPPKHNLSRYRNLESSRPRGCFKRSGPFQKTPPRREIRGLRISFMLGLDGEDIVVKLVGESQSLVKTLDNSEMSDDTVSQILQIIEKACTGSTHHQNNLKLVIGDVENSVFFKRRLLQWIRETKISDETQKSVDRICTLCTAIMQHSTNPMVAADRVSHVVSKLLMNYRTGLTSDDKPLDKDILLRFDNLYVECNRVQSESEDSQQLLAINQFRAMPVLPDISEIRSNELPGLKAILKEGAYDSVDAYLDTIFRLLREDFVAPLRNGISSFIKQQETKDSNAVRLDDVRVYRSVHILNPVCGYDGISYRVQFSIRGWRTNQLEKMKVLCYGSLVCLSRDDFVSGLFGVVANRNPEDIKQGIIGIQFQYPVTDPSMYSNEYIMVESIAFFEAYRPVLEGLQKIKEDTLPLKDYIVKASRDFLAPLYLRTAADQTYDLSPLYKQQYKRLSLPTHMFSGSPMSLVSTTTAQTTSNEPAPSSSSSPDLCQTSDADSDHESPDSKAANPVDCGQKTEENYSVSDEQKTDDGNVEEKVASPVLEKVSEDIKPVKSWSNPREIAVLNFADWPDETMVHLDDSQLRAVHAALTQELAVIQGPPGTGKTYVGLKIMEVLLRPRNQDVWSEGKSGPILIVCYTNHALDQFLEGVLKFEKNIVRIGGRSQSETLKTFNLNNLTKRTSNEDRFKRAQKWQRHKTREAIEAKVSMAVSFQTVIHNAGDLLKGDTGLGVMCKWLGIDKYIIQKHYQSKDVRDTNFGGLAHKGGENDKQRSWYGDFEESRLLDDEIDDCDMQNSRTQVAHKVSQRGTIDIASLYKWAVESKDDRLVKILGPVKKELRSSAKMSKQDANRVTNIWRLCRSDRWRLYRYWVDMYRTTCLVDTVEDTQMYDERTRAITEIDNDDVCQLLKRVKVIGMTTTGAAKKQSILQRVGARIVVVEEAAEVMEAHVIAALSQHCQHLILIGDHQQLRPNPAVYRLAKQYHLDLSLFERLVNNEYPCQTLSRQHRMRPEISEIMRNHFYKDIQDDDSVQGMENIRGLAKNMFFINHDLSEDDEKDGLKSHSSEHEANMVVALCKHILRQGYSPSQITVLTTYKGQLFSIKPKLDEAGCGMVRVSVVDNYQGEECDIIILSLVRSNDQGKIGFLKTSNRVCVMLSRAKMGLYCIGNFDQLSANSALWKAITDELKTKKLLGNKLVLACHLHPDEETLVACADDFKKAPEGGCMRPCTFRLTCGHSCTKLCHPDDSNHEQFRCQKSCERKIVSCQEGHKCQRRCSEQCTKICSVPVQRLLPRCNHLVTMRCSDNPDLHKCDEKVLRTDLPCGHKEKMLCHEAPDQCPHKCKELLACGHHCTGSCRSCFGGRLHVSCAYKICGRVLVCGHECSQRCSSYCPPCERNCENRCTHSNCHKKCGEPCAPCLEPCRWRCAHGEGCSKKCSEPCDRDPCDKACTKELRCGHKCIGICGEPCPSKCRVCDKAEVTEILFGNEDEADARFVQLQDCKHIVEVTGLDRWMTQVDSVPNPNVEVEEEDGELSSEPEQSTVSIQLKSCPKCKTPIRRSTRYNREVVKMLSDIEAVKAQVSGGSDRAQQFKQSKSELITMLFKIDANFNLFTSVKREVFLTSKLRELERDSSSHDFNKLLNETKFACKLIKLRRNLRLVDAKDSPWFEKTMSGLLKVGKRLFNSSRPFRGTNQELIDFPNELHRLYFCCNACSLQHLMHGRTDSALSSELDQVGDILFREGGRLTPDAETRVTELLKKIKEGIGALGISEETKIMIVAAMGLKKGHWFKCPNGHIYAIGECGGAMEKSRCPECKADIGGTSHKLTSGNAVATEMDGAQFAAWSEQANMDNYDLQNLDL
ncbi:NFX1-type zinc finger-containing protein 1-like isoform X2 [Asterias rubens]|uniref:NFX1-type zinc finger-containing protein 1-like isoform X2 n=1 Tax=Asterias rubens TaxID=7604 RepID=UPI0014558491|nr:NFX1-type zinc finger-containing protein 1-like isoform X2 [Asterias rubens]